MTQKQIKHVDAYGTEIKSGDTVKVIAVLPEGNYDLPGFYNSWQESMARMLGKTFMVVDLGITGVRHPEVYSYPSFCLEVIDEEQIMEDKLQEILNTIYGGDESKMLRAYYKKVYLNQN